MKNDPGDTPSQSDGMYALCEEGTGTVSKLEQYIGSVNVPAIR